MLKKRISCFFLAFILSVSVFESVVLAPPVVVNAEVVALTGVALYTVCAITVTAFIAVKNADELSALTSAVIEKLGSAWFSSIKYTSAGLEFTASKFTEFKNALWEVYGELKGTSISSTVFDGVSCASISLNTHPYTEYAPTVANYSIGKESLTFGTSIYALNKFYNEKENNYMYNTSLNGAQIGTNSSFDFDYSKTLKIRFLESASIAGVGAIIVPFVNSNDNIYYYGIFYKTDTSAPVYRLFNYATVGTTAPVYVLPSDLVTNDMTATGDITITIPKELDDSISTGVAIPLDSIISAPITVVDSISGVISTPSDVGGGGDNNNNNNNKINWSPFLAVGSALKEAFPFCLPFVFTAIVSELVAEPVPLKIEKDVGSLIPGMKPAVVSIDFEQFDSLIRLIRIGELVSVIVSLIFITKRLIN